MGALRAMTGPEAVDEAEVAGAVRRWESAIVSACDAWDDVVRLCAAAGLDPVNEAFDGSRVEDVHILFDRDGMVKLDVSLGGDDASRCMAGFNGRHELLLSRNGTSSSEAGTRKMRFLAKRLVSMSNEAESRGWEDGARPNGAVLARIEVAVVDSPSHSVEAVGRSIGGAR